MSFPVHDWQFWVVTAAMLGALLWIVWGVLPIDSLRKRRARKRRARRAPLTVEGKPVDRQ